MLKATLPCVLALSVLGLAAPAHAAKWDMPLAYPATNFHSENAAEFATCVSDKTDGDLDITTHPNGSLFSGDDIKRAVQTGQAEIGERVTSAHENENALFGVEAIPFIATSFDASDELWQVALPYMTKLLDSQNLVYVYSVPWPASGFYTKEEINTVDDLKGIKFRAYNAATARIAELAGMAPMQIEQAELGQALSTGVVDSFMTSNTTGVDTKVWEMGIKHFYNVQAWHPRNTVFINKKAWNDLDDATRDAITECGAAMDKSGLEKVKKLDAEYLETLDEHGVKVSSPSAELEQGLAEFGEIMAQEWLERAGADGEAILEAYNAN
ncbi:MAG TPA: TRAP transporter substrate-binding protein [Burkholderiaceae bacterium]|nr:TRAP transporter substrate-binding protein [Burkholderiaceae bacterium]